MKKYKEVEKEIGNFLNKNWREVFDMWLSCTADIAKSLEVRTRTTGMSEPFLYDSGMISGIRTYQWLSDKFKLEEKDVKEKTFYTDAFFSQSGMGKIEFLKKGERVLRFKKGTFFAKRAGRTGKKVCYYVAGFIAGATNTITGREYKVEEVRCISDGDDHCDFLIKPLERRMEFAREV